MYTIGVSKSLEPLVDRFVLCLSKLIKHPFNCSSRYL